jgi:hypothetical protein
MLNYWQKEVTRGFLPFSCKVPSKTNLKAWHLYSIHSKLVQKQVQGNASNSREHEMQLNVLTLHKTPVTTKTINYTTRYFN